MERIALQLGQRLSQIFIEPNLLQNWEVLPELNASSAFILYDDKLGKVARTLSRQLKVRDIRSTAHSIPVSEAAKDFRRLPAIYTKMLEANIDRDSVLIAVGGGVIGDLGGFVAATYLRGIRWIGVPTTLLAQVDSSVGGKTGVNHPLGKNLIGSFHQPVWVLCDPQVLHTLSKRDWVSGYGEMIKYGITFDAPFFRELVAQREAILSGDDNTLSQAIFRSLSWKAKTVRADEFEQLGKRKLLNFGHTLAHALESATRYRRYRHGEAVVVGMRYAAALSAECGYLPAQTQAEIERALRAIAVPRLGNMRFPELTPYLRRDKKVSGGKLSFVLLKELGQPIVDNTVQSAQMKRAWERLEDTL